MIQTYHLLDGGQITADTPEQYVRLLRESRRYDYESTEQYNMENIARPKKELHVFFFFCKPRVTSGNRYCSFIISPCFKDEAGIFLFSLQPFLSA